MRTKYDSYCGLSCEACDFHKNGKCGGCIATEGNPFHGKCDVAECAKKRKRGFCGECEKFPCDTLKGYAFDKENGDNGARIENCKSIKMALVAEGREGLNPVAVCGFHCDHCMYGQWCGGCRSTYNCCSYATLFEDGICPNVKCADSKKLEGCFDCPELENCKIGFYSLEKDGQFLAKATAIFVHKYGQEVYTNTMLIAEEEQAKTGIKWSEGPSVQAILEKLEGYMKKL